MNECGSVPIRLYLCTLKFELHVILIYLFEFFQSFKMEKALTGSQTTPRHAAGWSGPADHSLPTQEVALKRNVTDALGGWPEIPYCGARACG